MGWLQLGPQVLHSGKTSEFKIECDEIDDATLGAAGSLLRALLPPYGDVEGVPTGGERLARVMRQWSRPEGPLLIVDDVLTTGDSMTAHRDGRLALGAVLFARGPCLDWVKPLFTLHPAVH